VVLPPCCDQPAGPRTRGLQRGGYLNPEFATDTEHRARFRQEAMSAARLRHPHLVDVTDQGTTADGLAYFVMGYPLVDLEIAAPTWLAEGAVPTSIEELALPSDDWSATFRRTPGAGDANLGIRGHWEIFNGEFEDRRPRARTSSCASWNPTV